MGASAGKLPSLRRALSVGLLAASRFSPRLRDDARAPLLSAPEFYSVLSHDHKEGSSQGAAPGTVAAGAPIPTVSDCQLTPAQETLQHWQDYSAKCPWCLRPSCPLLQRDSLIAHNSIPSSCCLNRTVLHSQTPCLRHPECVGPEPQAWNKCCLLQEALSEHPGTEGFAHMNVLVALACVPLSPSPVNSFLMNPASPAMVGPHVPEGWAWPPPLLPQQVAPSTSRAQEDRASLGPGTTETLGCGTAVLLHRWAMER
ncbi:uncharacterized protein LOC129632547 isoform X2 [Bubalus kerabau]|uniref:uncharacterized protein LOC129632547 isoform X2 n=1 Tax=Bubalus carabanensis TaxID=3119969 RepID=UPI00244E9777|nr:uncharacterized protein LOC129632547 isoform X2 [Bubalus carabanensis]